jgi:hypothetical protein
MSQISISGNATGTGVFTVTSPNSNSNYTLTLPTATTTVVGTDATQTLTNKTIQGGCITSGTSVASTSGTSIDFTSIPSWTKRITVMFNGVSTNGTSSPQVQIGSGSVLTTGYLSGASFAAAGNVTGAVNSTTGFPLAGVTAANTRYGHMILTNISGNIWVSSNSGGFSDGAAGFMGGGVVTLSGALDRVRVTTVNGTDTFDAGSINILYEG